MNNKKIGNDFEDEFCDILAKEGFWVHFLSPNKAGAQPFDVFAVKDNVPYAFDCKTSAVKWFSINRLEDNQIYAFEKWIKCGNSSPYVAVKYNNCIYLLPYDEFKNLHDGKVNLEENGNYCWKRYSNN